MLMGRTAAVVVAERLGSEVAALRDRVEEERWRFRSKKPSTSTVREEGVVVEVDSTTARDQR